MAPEKGCHKNGLSEGFFLHLFFHEKILK